MSGMLSRSLLLVATITILSSCRDNDDVVAPKPDVTPAPTEVPAVIVSADYRPAPGQFVNVLPQCEQGDDAAAMNAKCVSALNNDELVTLGAFGGSVTLRVSQPIVNHPGRSDFKVTGNAFVGSAEPGVVEVSADGVNWYWLRGEHWDAGMVEEVVYMPPVPGADDAEYILWQCGTETGYLPRVSAYHTQPYFAQWLEPEQNVTLRGRRLPSNVTIDEGIFRFTSYSGYADSYPNNTDEAWLDLDDAVDDAGNPVDLMQISYIRITTGVLGSNGDLGEISTEVSGVRVWR